MSLKAQIKQIRKSLQSIDHRGEQDGGRIVIYLPDNGRDLVKPDPTGRLVIYDPTIFSPLNQEGKENE